MREIKYKTMISTKLHARQLAALLLAKKITDVVLAPGSRSGPLSHTFAGCRKFDCRTIVDERSAGYFALGLAQKKQNPVVLLCSSGTAAINFAPAVAEAYYLGVPLIVVTADRPQYWIDQMENQCINQQNLYHNSIKKSCTLPIGEDEKELWFAARTINELLNTAVLGKKGPVHINIPFEEPLHQTIDQQLPEIRNIAIAQTEISLGEETCARLSASICRAKKILLLVGQQSPDAGLDRELFAFACNNNAVVLSEHLANVSLKKGFFFQVDLLSYAILAGNSDDFRPDLLITCGGHCVSKALKQFLRKNSPQLHFHIGDDDNHIDTYQALTTIITMPAARFFQQLNGVEKECAADNGWRSLWQQKNSVIERKYQEQLEQAPFSDIQVYNRIFRAIPESSVIHLGNSSPVRYALLNPPVKGALYLGNRGTSGIDGSLSTAIGYASSCCEKINTIVLGDLSFFYDSNGLWNKYVTQNLRIILINNGGGNIFGFLEQLEKSPAFQQHFFANHDTKAEPFARAFGLDYLAAASVDELEEELQQLYLPGRDRAALLEVFTVSDVNTMGYKKLIADIRRA